MACAPGGTVGVGAGAGSVAPLACQQHASKVSGSQDYQIKRS